VLAILPFVPFCLCILLFRHSGYTRKQSLLFATIPSALFGVYATEILGAFHTLTRSNVAVAWTVCAGICGAAVYGQSKSPVTKNRTRPDTPEGPALDRWDRIALIFAVALVVIAAITALVAAPNTADSMQYHLPRVVLWMDNHSVQNYPTIDHQQLGMPPLAEYAMLHLHLLFGSDRLVNLVQWLGYLGIILCVSLIIEELGGDRKAQVFGVILAVTLPTALMGASGPKNDNVLAYWFAATVYFLLLWRRQQGWWLACAIASCGSLAAFTKGTAYVLMPAVLLACWFIWDSPARRKFLLFLPVSVVVLVSICGPLWVRNHDMAGSFLGTPYFDGVGPVEHRRYANSDLGPSQIFAGVVRNISLDLSVPSKTANRLSTKFFRGVIHAAGVDPDDPHQMTFRQDGTPIPFTVDWTYRDEILSANQAAFLLFIAACAFYLVSWKTMRREWGWLALGLIGAFAMYAALLRWAPWNGRYHLPVIALGMVFVSLVLCKRWHPVATRAIIFFLLFASLPLALMNDMRPWLTKHARPDALLTMPREQMYFLDGHQRFLDAYVGTAHSETVRACRSIAFDASLQHYEYPVMAIIKGEDPSHAFQYVSVGNQTTKYAQPSEGKACAVLCMGCAGHPEKIALYSTNAVTEQFGDTLVFSNHGANVVIGENRSLDAR
jgi:hypothetical protein